MMSALFDNMDGKFVARLRDIVSSTRSTSDGKATITFRTARIEADYSPDMIKRLEVGRLVAMPNIMGIGSDDCYSVYEIADVYPMHYSMLTLDPSQPGAIRKEFMGLIEREWQQGSKSTWIEIVAAPTSYIMKLDGNGQPSFIRKNVVPLTGSKVCLLSRDLIQKFICYMPGEDPGKYAIGNLLGVTGEGEVPFTVNMEKLLHYHVGVFAFTGAGKSNLTSMIVRRAVKAVPKVKMVIFDISSEYGISTLDVLEGLPSRIIVTEDLNGETPLEKAEDYYRQHVVPEALLKNKDNLLFSIKNIIEADKIKTIEISSRSDEAITKYTTYGGLIDTLSDTLNEKFGSAPQKVLIPTIVRMIRQFLSNHSLEEDAAMDSGTLGLIDEVEGMLGKAKMREDAALKTIFANLRVALENTPKVRPQGYDGTSLVEEIMSLEKGAPQVFVINLPEADVARNFCSNIINQVFRARKSSFTLDPRIIFMFDEAQEFIPYETRKEDGTEYSSRAVERLLRHGRKYHLHGWISTQRIAHLNTNALQQLHSYFVSTMPRPYDRQLISETFAIDDAFMDRTLMFQNGDWLMTSFKATNTQNVPVFFHAFNNEDFIATMRECPSR